MTQSILDSVDLNDFGADASQPMDAIRQVATERGINPDHLIGLAKLETRLGDASIKGGGADTRNLFNVKDFSKDGTGVRARDGAEGSNDRYRQYASYRESVEDLVGLLGRRYPGALKAQSGQAFAEALKRGGYASDPNYVSKLTGVIGGAGGAPSAASEGDWLSGMSDDDILAASGFGAAQVMDRSGSDGQSAAKSDGMVSGLMEAGWQGVKGVGRSILAAGGTAVGALSDVELIAKAQNEDAAQDPAEKQALMQEIQRRKKANPEAGVWQAVKDVGSAAMDNKTGAAQLVVSQLPNTAVALGGGWAGAQTGAALGTMVAPGVGTLIGGALGGLTGMFLGNYALETGGKAIEKAGDGFTQQEADDTLKEGAIKAGVITGVDALTMGVGKLATRAFSGSAVKAGARAEAKVLADAGVDITDGAKIAQALTNTELRAAAKTAGEAAAKSASSVTRRTGNAATGLTMETVGEGTGEYWGEELATGKGDVYDAALESLASLSQSGIQTAQAMRESGSNDLSVKGILQAQLGDQIAKGNSPLSRAADASLNPTPPQGDSNGLPSDPTATDPVGPGNPPVDPAASLGTGLGPDAGLAPDALRPPAADLGTVAGDANQAAAEALGGELSSPPLEGTPIDATWTAFHPESGTLNVPREQMPQIKSEHRGAMVNFLKARGVDSEADTVAAEDLKPTQDKFSPAKVDQAQAFEGSDRPVLVSSDGFVLDGHHQWLAKARQEAPVKVIRLNAPIAQLLALMPDFASAGMTKTPETQAAPATRTQVAAPRMTLAAPVSPTNTGTEQVRQRRAQLNHMAQRGFTDMEQRDGVTYLVNPKQNAEMPLGSSVDVAWARQAVVAAGGTGDTVQQTTGVQDGKDTGAAGAGDRGRLVSESQGDGGENGSARDQGASARPQPTGLPTGAARASVQDHAAESLAVARLKTRVSSVSQASPGDPGVAGLKALLAVFERFSGHRGYAIHDAANDGMAYGGDTFVSVDSPHMHVAWTIGHEFAHFSERYPGIKALYDAIWKLIDNEAGKRYYYQYLAQNNESFKGSTYDTATPEQMEGLKQEMVADFLGKRLWDKAWLTDIARKKPDVFGKFVNDWIPLLGSLIQTLRGMKQRMTGVKNVDQYISKLQDAKDIAQQVLEIWAKERPGYAQRNGVQRNAKEVDLSEDIDLDFMAELQAELDAEMTGDDPGVTEADIRERGLQAEDAFPDLAFEKSGSDLVANIPDLYRDGDLGLVQLDSEADGLWGSQFVGTWIGPANTEKVGYATLKMAKAFARRFVASKELRDRQFDLASAATPGQQNAVVQAWKTYNTQDDVRRYPVVNDTLPVKAVAAKMGLLRSYDISARTEVMNPQARTLVVEFVNKANGEEQAAILELNLVDGKWLGTANTSSLTRGGLGAAFYQMMVEYAGARGITIHPDHALSGVNTYRRTEQMLSAALRTGKSNVMVPHPTQRVYGFNNDAQTPAEHDANLARLLLAGLRNVQELAPGAAKLVYHPETGTFTNKKGKDQEAAVRKMLEDTDARAFGLGRATLARAVLTRMAMAGEAVPATSFKEPVLYSARETADAEYQAVLDRYQDTEQWLKVPSGAPTLLTPRQWVQVRTPSFKAWFGDWEAGNVWENDDVSKVIDDNGEPLVVYHGTDKGGFYAFKDPDGNRRGDLGIFTTPNRDMASSYVRRGRERDITPPESQKDLEALGYEFQQGYRIGEKFYATAAEAKADQDDGDEIDVAVRVMGEGGYSKATGPDKSGGYFDTLEQAVATSLKDFEHDDKVSAIYATFLNIRNPNEEDFEGALWSGSREHLWQVVVDGETQESGGKIYMEEAEARELAKSLADPDDEFEGADYLQPADDHWATTDQIVIDGRRMSNDGAIIRNVVDDGGGYSNYDNEPSDVFVAFKPEQIKSADFNTGEFGEADDIRYSTRGINPAVVEAVPEVSKLAAYLAPSEKTKLRKDTAQKMVDIYRALPSADEMAAVAYAGKAKRFWYRNSLTAIAHIFGADGWRFTGMLAATSPQCSVEANLQNALNIWKNWVAAGRPQGRAEIVAVMGRSVQGNKGEDSVLNAWVNNTVSALTAKDFSELVLSGPKVDSFMRNLLGHYYEVTNDAWIANYSLMDQKIFSGSKNKAGTEPGKGPGYLAMNVQTRKAANKLGWQPAEVQETVWSWSMSMLETMDKGGETRGSQQLLADGAMTDEIINATPDFRSLFHLPVYANILEQSGYQDALATLEAPHTVEDHGPLPFKQDKMDKLLHQAGLRLEFLQRQRRTSAQISWEARPGESTGVLPGIHKAPLALQQQYLADVYAAIESAGFYKMTDLSLRATLFGPSAWQAKVLAGAQSLTRPGIVADNKGGLMVDPESRAKINLAASVLGLVLNQEGVYWHYPIYKGGNPDGENGVEINFGRSLSHVEMAKLYDAIIQKAGHSDWAPANTPTGVRVLNFSNTPHKVFHRTVKLALTQFEKSFDGEGSARTFSSDGDAIENNWKEKPNGQDYLARISQTGRPDLLQWVGDVLQPAIDQVNQRYSEEHGWGSPTRGDIQRSARDTSGPGLGSGAGDTRTVRGAVHFGKQPGLTLLAGRSNGTGIRGAEDQRVRDATDPRIKQRVYFYSPVDGGIPQPETGLGGAVYQADLDGLYDPRIANKPLTGSGNTLESAVLDAGYTGYIDPESGVIVVLGRDVPVKHMGSISDFKLVQRVATRFIPKNTTRTEGDELVRKPEGQEMAQLANPKKQAKIREAAPSFRLEYGSIRVKASEADAADQAIAEFSPTFRFGEPAVKEVKPTAAGVIFRAKDTGRLLLAHRGGRVSSPNTWSTWGGAIDDGETAEQAAHREVREEAGYDQPLRLTPLYLHQDKGLVYQNFVADVDAEFAPKLNPENQAYKWVNPEQMPDNLHPGMAALLANPQARQTLGLGVQLSERIVTSEVLPNSNIEVKQSAKQKPAKPRRDWTKAKVNVPVKIEATGEVGSLTMPVVQTLDEYDERTANMKRLLECL